MKMNIVYLVVLLLTLTLANFAQETEASKIKWLFKKCNYSSECPRRSCCRDSDGNILMESDPSQWIEPITSPIEGVCRRGFANEGEKCNDNCQCKKGFKCYRQVTGVCCAPFLCYTEAYVNEQEEYWRKCAETNTCLYPP